jgi:hypothetical protein
MSRMFVSGRRISPRTLAVVCVIAGLLCATVLVPRCAAAGQKNEPPSKMVEGAEAGTRTIVTAEMTYSRTYNTGFSRSLAELGGPAAGSPVSASRAFLVDELLAAGKKGGYVFVYKPSTKGKDGKTNSYTLNVRPIKWQKGLNSIFTDQSGVIHETAEDRAATAKDPELKD